MTDPARVRAIFGSTDMAWLVDRWARRIEQGEPLAGTMRLPKPTASQREALARVTGRYGRGDGLVVDLDDLARQLSETGVADSLLQVVTALRGSVAPRAEARAKAEAAWDTAFGGRGGPGWEDLRRTGLVKRLVGNDPTAGAALLTRAAQILERLPADGLPLAELASTVGDAHALDVGRPLATIVLRIVRAATGVDPTDRRLAWSSVGVEVDPLSTSVLVLGLRARGNALPARLLAECAEAGEPCRLTLRQVRCGIELEGDVIYVCENPSVVLAAAERLGTRSRPLVCVEGQPGSAARVMLDAAGARVRYHGDFDWPGVRIASGVLLRTGGTPWRFDSTAYASAPKGIELTGSPVDAPWSPGLAEAMVACGQAVHEEAVVGALLDDLEQ